MIKITTQVRATIRGIVATSSDYDADSVRIGRDGTVRARIDYDKAPCSNRNRPAGYFVVGDVSAMMADAQVTG